MDRDTQLQHHGDDRERHLGAVAPPVFRTSLFTFPDCQSLRRAFSGAGGRSLYSRVANPTVEVFESKVAALEQAAGAVAFASGMGAVSAVLLTFLRPGDHMVCQTRVYGPTLSLVHHLAREWDVKVSFVAAEDLATLPEHLEPRTRLVYLESPASLTFEVGDLRSAAAAARGVGVTTVADNSWATPVFHRPLELGIDLVLHSATKYLSGHSDVLAGVIAGSSEKVKRVRRTATVLGACLSPSDAFLATRGLRTLTLRMERHQQSAQRLAAQLEAHPRVKSVLHPALESFPSHELWRRQFSGASGLFAFRLDGDPERFCDALRVFHLGVSWGGFESLALPHGVVAAESAEARLRGDIPADLIRLSVGLEDVADLWEDLERGFAASQS